METKNNLNNTQRKMLDEVYTSHFETIARGILDKRKLEYEKLEQKVKNSFYKKNKAKIESYLKAGKALAELEKKAREDEGISMFRWNSDHPKKEVEVSISNGDYNKELHQHREQTRKTQEELSRKKKEIRARIYGMDMTYEQVEKEIESELKKINL